MDSRHQREVKTKATSADAACAAWAALEQSIGPLSAAATQQNAERMILLLDQVQDASAAAAVRGAPLPGADGLVRFLTEWVQAYESTHQQIPDVDPVELLRHLMETNGLKQSDLAKDLGGQPVVSGILNGKRLINARQALALAKRFGISAAAFIADPNKSQIPPTDSFEAVEVHARAIELGSMLPAPTQGGGTSVLSTMTATTARPQGSVFRFEESDQYRVVDRGPDVERTYVDLLWPRSSDVPLDTQRTVLATTGNDAAWVGGKLPQTLLTFSLDPLAPCN
jgi:antitoxin component HigA of HigAB toxin-antitoxin module